MTYTLSSDNGIYLLATLIKSLRGIVRLNSQEVSETLHMNRVSKLPGTQVEQALHIFRKKNYFICNISTYYNSTSLFIPPQTPSSIHILWFFQVTRGKFFVDSFLGRDTRFGIFVEDEEDHR